MLCSRKIKNFGFTLIELLIVIAIISLLSSVVLASLSTAKKKARDVRRQSDLVQISKALEIYYDLKGPVVETQIYDTSIGGGADLSSPIYDWLPNSDLRQLVSSGVLKSLPLDPINNSTYYYRFEPYNANENVCGKSPLGTSGMAVMLCINQYETKAGGECSTICF